MAFIWGYSIAVGFIWGYSDDPLGWLTASLEWEPGIDPPSYSESPSDIGVLPWENSSCIPQITAWLAA